MKNYTFCNKLADKIYQDLKFNLNKIYENAGYNSEEGITEEQIVTLYSDRYNLPKEYFKNNILPRLKAKRNKDKRMRFFSARRDGELKIIWQLF